jgi:N-ethylmaleimide reductase
VGDNGTRLERRFDQMRAEAVLAEGVCDAVAFGRAFISNPDVVERFRRGEALNDWDPDTFYQGGDRGYLDYPALP